jgi:hypothetical protein
MKTFVAFLIFFGFFLFQWFLVARILPFETSAPSPVGANSMSKAWTLGEALRDNDAPDYVFFRNEKDIVTASYSVVAMLVSFLIFVIPKQRFTGAIARAGGGGYHGKFFFAFFGGLIFSIIFGIIFAVDSSIIALWNITPIIVIPLINAIITALSFYIASDSLPLCRDASQTTGTYRFTKI